MSTTADWPARPFDPKCRDRVPIDNNVVAQISRIIPEWSVHDWQSVRAAIEARLPAAAMRIKELAVHDIRLLFNQLVGIGQLPHHTANTSSTTCRPIEVPAGWTGKPKGIHTKQAEGAGDGNADDIGRIARRLTPKAREVILYMYDMGAFSGRDKLTRAFIADELNCDIDSLVPVRNEFRQYETAFDRKLYDAKDGRSGGWWLEPDGKLVAERLKTGLLSGREQAATPTVVRLA